MKTNFLTALIAIVSCNAFSQGCDNIALPYNEQFESAQAPELPNCVWSNYSTFGSAEIFETTTGTISGFNGKAAQYNTVSLLAPDQSVGVACNFYAGSFTLSQDQNYEFSVRFGKSQVGALANISILILTPEGGGDYITLANQDIPDANVDFSQTFTAYVSGSYEIMITVNAASNSGFVYLDDVKLQAAATAGTNNNQITGLSIYPNPVKNVLNITHNNIINGVKIYSSTGQLLIAEEPNNNQVTLNIERLAAGVYFVNTTAGGFTKQSKVIKE